MAYIHVYTGTPTAGGTNGTQISEGTGSAPLSIGPLNATNSEVSAWVKCAIRCETGYTTSDAVIDPISTSAGKWQLAADNAGSPSGTPAAYGEALSIGSVAATNVIFWARAKATSDESPVNDVSVDLQVTATIAAA